MEGLVKGEVAVTNFPLTDLKSTIKRPALIIATLKGDNIIVCQITKKERHEDPYKISLIQNDFISGGLKKDSFIMPSILFSIRNSIVLYRAGRINDEKIEEVENKIIEIIKN
jgi:mRNA interferase MazF|tara:strand:- start:73 stop:408 length:336 start_codon:yes stop_codon:yes gene_type:complete